MLVGPERLLLEAPYDRESVDVVLLDQPLSTAWDGKLELRRAELEAKPIGIIGVGLEIPDADANLDGDCEASELRLACQLLGEIVRLRRQQQVQQHHVRKLVDETRLDHQTGVGNRRAWDEMLQQWAGGLLAVLDVDRFKEVNDQHGHAAGDGILRHVAKRLSENVRDGDFAARLGGDEFGLLLCDVREDAAFEVAERIRESVATILDDGSRVTSSLGFVRSGAESHAELMELADQALMAAKSAGRDCTMQANRAGD